MKFADLQKRTFNSTTKELARKGSFKCTLQLLHKHQSFGAGALVLHDGTMLSIQQKKRVKLKAFSSQHSLKLLIHKGQGNAGSGRW